jgi:hypothetical protein
MELDPRKELGLFALMAVIKPAFHAMTPTR